MMARLAALTLLLACGTSLPARAGVIVLANRTAGPVTFTAAGTSEQTVAEHEQAVLYADTAVTISYAGGKGGPRTYRLEPDAAYYFGDTPDGITLQGIGSTGLRDRPPDAPAANPAGVLLKPPPLETIPVRIFVDEEEPATQAVWEARLKKRIAAASAILERTCRVRLEVTGIGTWPSDNNAPDLPALLTDFERRVPRDPARLQIGFTSQRTPEVAGTLHLGGTRLPLHPYILVREWTPNNEPGRLEVLLHELGHYLGAVHSPEPISVMRPKLGDGRSLDRRFPVGYDPLNALAMNLVAGELRARHVRSLAQLAAPTKDRLAPVYREVQTAFPDDPTPAKFLAALQQQPPPQKAEAPPPVPAPPQHDDDLVGGARAIVAAVVKAAKKNQELPDRNTPGTAPPFRRSDDALTEYYVREAAVAARGLPPARAASAFLVGVAVALDDADIFRKNPVTGALWHRVESDDERAERLKVIGKSTMFNRHDSCQHFVDSAALVVVSGAVGAEAAGVVKELLDSREGGSGFSFADLASDQSGVVFGRHVLSEPERLAKLAEGFVVTDYDLPPDGLVEGLTYEEFARQFGSVADERFKRELDKLRKRARDLPAYNAAPPRRPPEKQAPEPAPPVPKAPEEKPAEKAAPEEKVPEREKEAAPAIPPEKTVPEPPAPTPVPPPAADSRVPTPSRPAAVRPPAFVLVLAGFGVAALGGSFYFVWPRRPAPGTAASSAPALAATALALIGLALLGGAYANWTVSADEPDDAIPTASVSDLEPPWTEAPVDPFEIPTIRTVRIPPFPGASAVGNATGRDGRGHIWFGVSTAAASDPSARLMEYDPDADRVTPRGDVVGELRKSGLLHADERQGAIRTRIVQARDGFLYFASANAAGDSDDDAPGAGGSHLWRVRPSDGRWEHLQATTEGLFAAACGGPYVYALGHPGNVLYQYECATGRVCSTPVGWDGDFSANAVLADSRGHAYVPRLRRSAAGAAMVLAEFSGELTEVAELPLERPGEPAGKRPQLVAVQPLADRSLALAVDRGFLFRVTPGAGDGPARVAALGAFHPRGDADVFSLFSPDGSRYLMGLARRPGQRDGRCEWLVSDLRAGRPVVVPASIPGEDGRGPSGLSLRGSMTRDDAGRFYAGGSYRRGDTPRPLLLQIRLPH